MSSLILLVTDEQMSGGLSPANNRQCEVHRTVIITDMLHYLEYLSMQYPELVEMITIGKSSLGQPLKVVKVSTGQRTKKGEIKPAVWIDGGEFNIS